MKFVLHCDSCGATAWINEDEIIQCSQCGRKAKIKYEKEEKAYRLKK